MKKEFPKYRRNEPSNNEERKIQELMESLDKITLAFIQINYPGKITQECFVVLRDAVIGYAGSWIRSLSLIMAEHSETLDFLLETEGIFECYINDLRERLKEGN